MKLFSVFENIVSTVRVTLLRLNRKGPINCSLSDKTVAGLLLQ